MDTQIILLVEDNHDDADLTRDTLRRAHILNKLLVLGDGAAALEFLQQAADPAAEPDRLPIVTLLDLNLPKLDGFELLKQIRADERLQKLAVIILTTSQEQEDVFKCYELYADGYVRKPVDVERLSEALRQAGLGWQLCPMPSAPAPARFKPDDS
ncbi:MAG TPA: response regulator [Verrucomicrobiae bacterium]